MASVRQLRKEASNLFHCVKEAYKYILDQPDSKERDEILNLLREGLDKVDPPTVDVNDITMQLVMTNKSADALIEVLSELTSEEDQLVLEAIKSGLRRTQERAYVRIEYNSIILRRLHYILLHTRRNHQGEVFKRLALQIEQEGFDKNPMEILGKLSL